VVELFLQLVFAIGQRIRVPSLIIWIFWHISEILAFLASLGNLAFFENFGLFRNFWIF
jgi:hypothetical protein